MSSNKQERSEAYSVAVIGGATVPKKRTKLLRYVADVCFFVYLVTNLIWAHTPLSQATMALFGLSVAALFLDNKRFFFHGWFVSYALLALWGLVGVLCGWAIDRTQATDMAQTLIINFVFLLCLYQYFVQRGSLTPGINAYLLASIVGIVLIIKISGPKVIHYRLGQRADVNPNLLASFLLVACAGALHLLLEKKRLWPLYGFATVLFFAGVLLTGSRKGLLGLAIVMVLYVLWSDRKHIVRNLIVLFFLAVAGCVVLFGIPKVYEVMGERLLWTIKSVLGLVGEEGAEWSMLERNEMANAAKMLFLQRPLTGWGLDCYRFASDIGTYAHNNYLELLADGGLPALLIYYVPLLWVIVKGFRSGNDDGAVRIGTSLVAMQVLLDIVAVSYYERVMLVVVPFLLAAVRLHHLKPKHGTTLWKYLSNPFRIVMVLGVRGMLDFLPDETYLRLMYRGFFGKKADFENPKTFNEKLNYFKLHDRRDIYRVMSDKYAVRAFLADKIGEEYLVPIYGVWDDAAKIDFDVLPERFVLKTTHDSGGVFVVMDKHNTDLEQLREKLNRCLHRPYGRQLREWQYEDISPRVIAEEYIGAEDGTLPMDYKFYCFHGEIKLIIVCTDRKTGVREWYCNAEGELLPCTAHAKTQRALPFAWPESLAKMRSLAQTVAADYPCLRVDFFDTPQGIRVGELTLYQDGGFCELFVDDWDRKIGDLVGPVASEDGEA